MASRPGQSLPGISTSPSVVRIAPTNIVLNQTTPGSRASPLLPVTRLVNQTSATLVPIASTGETGRMTPKTTNVCGGLRKISHSPVRKPPSRPTAAPATRSSTPIRPALPSDQRRGRVDAGEEVVLPAVRPGTRSLGTTGQRVVLHAHELRAVVAGDR